MPWITALPGTIVMYLKANTPADRFGILIEQSIINQKQWNAKFDDDRTAFLSPIDFVPILYLEENDTHEMPWSAIWQKYANRVHDVAHALFAQQIRAQDAVDEFRRPLPSFRSTDPSTPRT